MQFIDTQHAPDSLCDGTRGGHVQVKDASAESPDDVFAFYESRGIKRTVTALTVSSQTHIGIQIRNLACLPSVKGSYAVDGMIFSFYNR
jgi:hypothetical protein